MPGAAGILTFSLFPKLITKQKPERNIKNHQKKYADIVRYERGRCEDPRETKNLK